MLLRIGLILTILSVWGNGSAWADKEVVTCFKHTGLIEDDGGILPLDWIVIPCPKEESPVKVSSHYCCDNCEDFPKCEQQKDTATFENITCHGKGCAEGLLKAKLKLPSKSGCQSAFTSDDDWEYAAWKLDCQRINQIIEYLKEKE